jgi:hypothetical protein
MVRRNRSGRRPPHSTCVGGDARRARSLVTRRVAHNRNLCGDALAAAAAYLSSVVIEKKKPDAAGEK